MGIWELPKIRGTLSWGPYKKNPTIKGAILGPSFSETPISIQQSPQSVNSKEHPSDRRTSLFV